MADPTEAPQKRLLRVLAGEVLSPPPWWLMRQAGRYLPEYQALRARAGDFIALCLTPELAAEATLQPVRRYGMDAAILFSDILLVPRALGQSVSFTGNGPRLEPLSPDRLDMLGAFDGAMLQPVGEAARRVRDRLPQETALIGFAGAPWTVATYMVEGGTSRDFRLVKAWAYRDPESFAFLIERIVAATVAFLSLQIEAGVEAVQLFDSWAGALPEAGFDRWVVTPTRQIVAALGRRFPRIPVIGFPRGSGFLYGRYAAETGVAAISLDTTVPLDFARSSLPQHIVTQGNLDPVALLVGGDALRDEVRRLRRAVAGRPHIVNLGHGVLPETPPDHVAELGRLLTEIPGLD